MNNLDNHEFNCNGCGLCSNICPVNAISMELTNEGFYKYKIDEKKCIECGMCNLKCPQINQKDNSTDFIMKTYSAYSKNKKALKNSSSGAIFYELASSVFNAGGFVAGVQMNKDVAEHVLIDNKKDLKKLMGSKYLQSKTGYIYKEVKEKLKENKPVLFVGTPCQCASIKEFINDDLLLVVDIVCHGVPSKKVFEKSIEDRFGKKSQDLIDVKFRNKKYSWKNFSMIYKFSNMKREIIHSEDEWLLGFTRNYYLNDSCYDCKFSSTPRISDITIGDYWGIESEDPKFYYKNGDKGISIVLVNSNKGEEWFGKIKSNLIYKEQNFENSKKYNPRMYMGKYSKEMLERKQNFDQNRTFEIIKKPISYRIKFWIKRKITPFVYFLRR